jgi:hypothetical protein
MNFQSTQINYKQNYPFVLTGETNQKPLASQQASNNTIYHAVCKEDNLESQYKLQAVTGLPELACPNATNGPTTYSEISTATCSMSNDNKWWYAGINLPHQQKEQDRCIPQFQNSIQVCTPRDCAMTGNPDAAYLTGFECNKMWNNNTKRRFINKRVNR